MHMRSGRRGRGAWWGAVAIGGSIALVLSGAPLSAQASSLAADTIVCPSVAGQLQEIPAAAQNEVDRNLALLETQIQEANDRLADTQGQGGPNFVQNAILGPLADKRAATLDRIAIAIGRSAERPDNLAALATCRLSDSGGNDTSPSPSPSPSPAPDDNATSPPPAQDDNGGSAQRIVCPSVNDQLPEIPAAAQNEVDRNLALLETQIQEANDRLADTQGQGGPNFVQNAILGPLADKRAATLDRIAIAIGRSAERPDNLAALAPCSLDDAGAPAPDPGTGSPSPQPTDGQNGGGQSEEEIAAAIGPSAEDFIDIRQVARTRQPQARGNGSRGVFVSDCGTNEEEHRNTDNLINAPGVVNAAQHLHDYVGNVSADAFSTNESLAASDTTCRNKADQTTYFWPVLRVRGPNDEPGAPEVDKNNIGTPVRASVARLEYRGNPTSPVTAAPRFLRLNFGDAKAVTNGPANARPVWTCTGFTDRITDKYPICPSGSRVTRIFDMPSCWDGQNIDSANHRDHLVFPDDNGACPSGTKAVPQLRMTLIYNDLPNTRPNGTDVPFAVDSFASERHSPITDHVGAIGVISDQLMGTIVECINNGRRC
ncbi:hypothetical protein GCM10012278_56360 [Nonomuraea glycinis]|uniref:DUF1996 domain-containing protein n=2 Tax=Nonomuraea glycinis TaxID=2047744 RepID=A0A918A8R3_9ACTN|nr:hypothetical protein GCM10012278_56360 [Nonomuraea glycinis]